MVTRVTVRGEPGPGGLEEILVAVQVPMSGENGEGSQVFWGPLRGDGSE
jgi:hypothetical protein